MARQEMFTHIPVSSGCYFEICIQVRGKCADSKEVNKKGEAHVHVVQFLMFSFQ